MKKIVTLSQSQIQQLEEQAEGLIYLIYQLADIQEGLIMDAKKLLESAGDYRFNIKQDIDKIKHLTGNLREQVWKRHQNEIDSVVKFGEESDALRSHIEQYFYNEAINDYIPFGPDWQKDVMKLTKQQIVELYKVTLSKLQNKSIQ